MYTDNHTTDQSYENEILGNTILWFYEINVGMNAEEKAS